jgi:hypothetical protein
VLAACGGPERVRVRALVPGLDGRAGPVPGVAVVALPYDRDSVLRALEARAASPRPSTALLDSLFERFRAPFAALSAADERMRALADSQAAIQARLGALAREAPERPDVAAAAERLGAALAAATRERDAATAALDAARAAFGPASDSVRRALKGWEDSTYRDYSQATEGLVMRAGPGVVDTTRADGSATVVVGPGRWWIYARAWDALDPNAEWYWNVPVQGDSVVLSPENGRRRARY